MANVKHLYVCSCCSQWQSDTISVTGESDWERLFRVHRWKFAGDPKFVQETTRLFHAPFSSYYCFLIFVWLSLGHISKPMDLEDILGCSRSTIREFIRSPFLISERSDESRKEYLIHDYDDHSLWKKLYYWREIFKLPTIILAMTPVLCSRFTVSTFISSRLESQISSTPITCASDSPEDQMI